GTESAGRGRGARAEEIYNNTFSDLNHGTGQNRFLGTSRSATILMHDNQITGYWGNLACFELSVYRAEFPFFPWGAADATTVWDVNDPAGVFFSGTAAANSTNNTVTV